MTMVSDKKSMDRFTTEDLMVLANNVLSRLSRSQALKRSLIQKIADLQVDIEEEIIGNAERYQDALERMTSG